MIDFGSSCFTTDQLSSYVQSRSYRAPEVILGLSYGQKVDVWSLGCILAELLSGYVLFQVGSTHCCNSIRPYIWLEMKCAASQYILRSARQLGPDACVHILAFLWLGIAVLILLVVCHAS